ncbi:MAG: carboxypeptidase-like regulatory domain-containing protein, partial [Bacteroidota bacterium]
MRRFQLVVLFTCLASFSYGQDYLSISGVVVDASSNAPLAFSTISIKNKPIGVVANTDGLFDFTFEAKYVDDTIVVSRAGYELETLLISQIADGTSLEFRLVNKAVMLEEIVIREKPLTAYEIMELVRDNIKKNYPTKPFEFEAFYRDYKIENDKCIGLFEAAVSIYDRGYTGRTTNHHVLKEKVTLNQVRKSLAADFQSHVFNDMNIMSGLLGLNDMRYVSRALDRKNKKDYKYSLDGFTTIDDRLMYKVKADDGWVFTFYVDMETFAVPKIDMNFVWVDDIAENEWVKDDSVRYQQRSAKKTFDFQMIDGLLYPRFHSFTSDLHAFDADTGEPLFTSILRQEYMVTDIETRAEERPDKDELMDDHLMLEKQAYNYDPEFWENYNILKVNQQDEKLIADLEEKISLKE